MKNINQVKKDQMLNLQLICDQHKVAFNSMEKLLNAEKVKRLSKKNQYIKQTIEGEIEKIVGL